MMNGNNHNVTDIIPQASTHRKIIKNFVILLRHIKEMFLNPSRLFIHFSRLFLRLLILSLVRQSTDKLNYLFHYKKAESFFFSFRQIFDLASAPAAKSDVEK